jgi:hypothetical protein
MRKFALILMLLTLLIPASGLPAGVGDDCEFRLDHVYTMDRLELSRLLDRPACRHLHPEALQRLDEIVVAGVLSGEYSRTVLDGLAWLRATGRLRVALDAEDLPAALAALTTLEADLASHASQAHADHSYSYANAAEIEAELLGSQMRWIEAFKQDIALAAMLQPTAYEPLVIERPGSDWILGNGCRTVTLNFTRAATERPSRADAWLVAGHPDTALRVLVDEQWLQALSLGMVPPRLKALAETAYGKEAYEVEVQHALRTIRFHSDDNGSVAELTLFGMTLPVPVGAPPRYGASVERFMDAEDIARYLEPLLKAGVDDGSGHQALQWVERSP